MVRILPVFRGYTVDERLRQFRKVTLGECPAIEFVDFASHKGKQLLGQWHCYQGRRKYEMR